VPDGEFPPLKPRHPAREMPRLATEERKGLGNQWPSNLSADRLNSGGGRKKTGPPHPTQGREPGRPSAEDGCVFHRIQNVGPARQTRPPHRIFEGVGKRFRRVKEMMDIEFGRNTSREAFSGDMG